VTTGKNLGALSKIALIYSKFLMNFVHILNSKEQGHASDDLDALRIRLPPFKKRTPQN
jgi:hypothetical protein